MQQAIYHTLNTPIQKSTPSRKTSVRRHLAVKWDLYCILTVIASTTVYGAFALAHVA